MFRVRTGRVTEASLVDRLVHQGFEVSPVRGLPGFYRVIEAPYPVSMTLEHWAGLLYVQQASTGVAPPLLGAQPGERVLDLCSAPGGKTTHLAELVGDRGCVVASEVDERRIRGLLGNVYRLLHPGVLTVACDGRDFPEGALFDRVLVDAPCSGEGTLRRRSGDVPNQSRSFLEYVTKVQRALLEKAVLLCRPGGSILYVTCTFSPDENEAVVSDVLARCPVDLVPLDPPVPHAPGLRSFEGREFDARLEGAVRIYPHHLDSGGLFVAKLRRRAGETPRGDAPPPRSEREGGWSPVPSVFPERPAAEPASDEEGEASERIARGVDVMATRYGVSRSVLDGWRWTVRGGKVWLHSADEWPMEAWAEGSWRPIAIGIRAFEFDSAGRPRPTNDLLRLLDGHVSAGRVELGQERLGALLEGDSETCEAPAGPVALSYTGEVVGRGMVGRGGLSSEIPKARAADLARVTQRARRSSP